MIMEKAVQRLKDPPQAAMPGEEVLHARSPKPCSSPFYVFPRGKTIQLLYSTPDFDFRKLSDLLNTRETSRQKSLSTKVFWSRIILAVSSIEFCQEIFDERDIREALSGGSGHVAMIPLRQIISFSLFVLNCNTSGKA